MDALIRRRRMHLAKCQEQIEKSRQMISLSLQWLTVYHDSRQSEDAEPERLREGTMRESFEAVKLRPRRAAGNARFA